MSYPDIHEPTTRDEAISVLQDEAMGIILVPTLTDIREEIADYDRKFRPFPPLSGSVSKPYPKFERWYMKTVDELLKKIEDRKADREKHLSVRMKPIKDRRRSERRKTPATELFTRDLVEVKVDRCPTCKSRVRAARGVIPPPPDRHVHVGVDYCDDKWHRPNL